MHLKTITLDGFKSFPTRTTLAFAPGVSVIVGPNGSGKSNVTDAVLWVMGEQSPLAVRGQSMQDVIFGGSRGVQARGAAEVELVIDNSDGAIGLPVSEISISRRLDRAGEGEYRLNGARCRLVDVIEVLSDTGLGKEMHSVISQGRVDSIVTSKPRDRRLLIEEAAGLGKHRKRRRRAQLKLERTQDNLDRALDVEREARSRLRPLKRQAEAAELHERLERQRLEAAWELARDEVRARQAALESAQREATAARAARDRSEAALAAVTQRRDAAEELLAAHSERREALARRAAAARAAGAVIALRLEQARATATAAGDRAGHARATLERLDREIDAAGVTAAQRDRIAELEAELARLEQDRELELDRELSALARELADAESAARRGDEEVARASEALDVAAQVADAARCALRDAERAAEQARRDAAAADAELAGVEQFIQAHPLGGRGATRALATQLEVDAGYEHALAAALGSGLGAAIVERVPDGLALLEESGGEAIRVLVTGAPTAAPPGRGDAPPVPSARRLADFVRGPADSLALARRLLADAWLVDDLADVPEDFAGTAVTRSGRAWVGTRRELRQVGQGGAERLLEARNRRERLARQRDDAHAVRTLALETVKRAAAEVEDADRAREHADAALREADRTRADSHERARSRAWLIEQRRATPQQGPAAVRRAELEGELAAERRLTERQTREHEVRAEQRARLVASAERDEQLAPAAGRLAHALEAAGLAIAPFVERVEADLAQDRDAGTRAGDELRACAAEEASIQARLREEGEAVTTAEVQAQRARDLAAEAEAELAGLAESLGLAPEPADEPLDDEQAEALRARVERLVRRREQLGPVNPLAKEEYDEALAHVEELEAQRTDMEGALRELRALIRETDREIREAFEQTFTAAARNFEELAERVFPGGRGRLRLVREDTGPRRTLGGQAPPADEAPGEAAEASEQAAEAEVEIDVDGLSGEDSLGVEIEITPAGKSMRRLTLLSGGEKSMTAIAFLFSVFLARPCPFYILDEVEAALDDLNLDRFLALLRAYSKRAQFIVVTHQKRTMEAADTLYGISMGDDGVSKVVSRRLEAAPIEEDAAAA